ncbi:MAG TPA: competence protein CoiA family protein [Pyrinomonadaceae bacterium]|nr:competence protein CoiA family protein [Pyrinomonadaceae bacterium]
MMTAIRQADGRKVGAWEAEREERPFLCPCCSEVVTLRRGGIIAPHFAHKPPVTCEYGTGESEEHRRCKISIFEALIADPRVRKCEMERDLGAVRPDVSAYINDRPVAIEVQASSLSLETIARRTEEYARRGIYVLWLPIYRESLKAELYNPRPFERWLHAAYNGRVYYWVEALRIQPVHFRDYLTKVRGRSHDYEKLSTKKVPIDGEAVTLTEDFMAVERQSYTRGFINVPQSKLFMDTQPAWYEAIRPALLQRRRFTLSSRARRTSGRRGA